MEPKRLYTHIPQPEVQDGLRILEFLSGVFLTPIFWIIAHLLGVPGIFLHRHTTSIGLCLLFSSDKDVSLSQIYKIIFRPFDSVRYFEFDFMWRHLFPKFDSGRYLDVSSPRLFPIAFLRNKPNITAEIINPDIHDYEVTRQLIRSLNLETRCFMHNCTIEKSPFKHETFDAITSISVIEHISRDTLALSKIWKLLKRGGILLLSFPCATTYFEEYVDYNEYGLDQPGENGFFFGQRIYDEKLIKENIISLLGNPSVFEVYGEKEKGLYVEARNRRLSKRRKYPYWREPLMMRQDWRKFARISDLPGWGLALMEFIKQ